VLLKRLKRSSTRALHHSLSVGWWPALIFCPVLLLTVRYRVERNVAFCRTSLPAACSLRQLSTLPYRGSREIRWTVTGCHRLVGYIGECCNRMGWTCAWQTCQGTSVCTLVCALPLLAMLTCTGAPAQRVCCKVACAPEAGDTIESDAPLVDTNDHLYWSRAASQAYLWQCGPLLGGIGPEGELCSAPCSTTKNLYHR
jgi:hypothetical protein